MSQLAGNYFMNIFNDYKAGVKDVGEEMRDHPKTAFVILSSIATSIFAYRTNPTEQDFLDKHIDCKHRMLFLKPESRNAYSTEYIQRLDRCYNYGLVRRTTFGVFSIMWIDNFDKKSDFYEARCKFLKVGWLELKDRVIDVGYNRTWHWLDDAMVNCDNGDIAETRELPPGLLCDSAT